MKRLLHTTTLLILFCAGLFLMNQAAIGYAHDLEKTAGPIIYIPLIASDRGGVDYAEMVSIPAGKFQMGCSENELYPYPEGNCSLSEYPLHEVTLEAYEIDRYEVTNARYKACVTAGRCTPPQANGSSTRSSYYNDPAYANYPVILVDWNQASAFCAWEGKRLPSEAEWEKAARGPIDSPSYPWGELDPDCTQANYNRGVNAGGYCSGDTEPVDGRPAGASAYGLLDVSGNVAEWVNDWYDENYYNVTPGSNPPGPASGSERVYRSGSWSSQWDWVRVSARGSTAPSSAYNNIGIRCARTK